MSKKTLTTRYDVAEHLRTPEEMAAYLEASIEEAGGDAACAQHKPLRAQRSDRHADEAGDVQASEIAHRQLIAGRLEEVKPVSVHALQRVLSVFFRYLVRTGKSLSSFLFPRSPYLAPWPKRTTPMVWRRILPKTALRGNG